MSVQIPCFWIKLTHTQPNPVSTPRKWFPLVSWTLCSTLLCSWTLYFNFLPKSQLLFLPTPWLSWFPFSSQLLALSSCLGIWLLILAFLLFTFGTPLEMGDVYVLAFSICGCSEVLTLLSQDLSPGPFLSCDLSQGHLCRAWLLQMGAQAIGKIKQGNGKNTGLSWNSRALKASLVVQSLPPYSSAF